MFGSSSRGQYQDVPGIVDLVPCHQVDPLKVFLVVLHGKALLISPFFHL